MPDKDTRAIDALAEANKIAFAPFVFQATVALRQLGILEAIFNHRKKGGITIQGISELLGLSNYGIGVLLEIADSSDIVIKDIQERFQLTKTGYFLAYNQAVDVNINFTNDVCYDGLKHLADSIKKSKPLGLRELGDWPTVYEGLSQLPNGIQKSWFEFDHHYSDNIFQDALGRVFKNKPALIFDIGGNTGKFAVTCLEHNKNVGVRIYDLPGQLHKALDNIKDRGFEDRVTGHEIDWLKENPSIAGDADVIWMSQFLDCFSEQEILNILKVAASAMGNSTELIIVESFTDRQKFDNAKFVLEATSLYFTAIANGNSKMYSSIVFEELITDAGLRIKEDLVLGDYHTMLVCELRS